jgi:membrane-associated phospholipid phosphatase
MLPRFRLPEWVLIGFFGYIALLSAFFPNRPNLRYQPLLLFLAIAAGYWALSKIEKGRFAIAIGITRDWLPLLLIFVAFREMELFLPRYYNYHFETEWIRLDQVVLGNWHLREAIESLGKALPFYFEFCYLLVYGVSYYCIGVLAANADRRSIDRFWTVYLTGTLAAYALFPYFPSQPPRYVFPNVDAPTVTTWLRDVNLFLLNQATIHVGVFPSAHVSSAFSAAWGLFLVKPQRRIFGWSMLIYAISVSIATVYGRYHYVSDVLAGFGVSLLAGGVCLFLRASD